MAHPQPRLKLRPFLLAGAGLAAVALMLGGAVFADARRSDVSDAERAASAAAVARMDAAQAEANAARAESQKRVYKGF